MSEPAKLRLQKWSFQNIIKHISIFSKIGSVDFFYSLRNLATFSKYPWFRATLRHSDTQDYHHPVIRVQTLFCPPNFCFRILCIFLVHLNTLFEPNIWFVMTLGHFLCAKIVIFMFLMGNEFSFFPEIHFYFFAILPFLIVLCCDRRYKKNRFNCTIHQN